MAQDPRTKALVKIIEAAGKRQDAERKYKRELLKMKLQSQTRMSEHKQKQDMKNQGPNLEQQLLARKVRERNPFMDINIPEEGSQDESVSFPSSKVDKGPRGLVEKPLNERDQASMFVTKYNKMLESGKKPHPSMKAVYDKYFQKLNRPKADTQKEYRTSKATQTALDDVSEMIASGKIKSKEDYANWSRNNEDLADLRGVDMKYVTEKAYKILPDKYKDRKGFMGTELGAKPDVKKVGDAWYKKSKNGWMLADPDDYADLVDA